jgi:hypothetical protein
LKQKSFEEKRKSKFSTKQKTKLFIQSSKNSTTNQFSNVPPQLIFEGILKMLLTEKGQPVMTSQTFANVLTKLN